MLRPSAVMGGVCFALFLVVLFDFILMDKASDDYNRLYRSAYYDALTGIPNRLNADLFVGKLALPDDLSVITADLDSLKQTNDTLGHLAGDVLIRNFANIFFQTALPYGFAARNGGDEFLAVFLQDGDGCKARQYCEDLKKAVENFNVTAACPLYYSIGCAWEKDGDYQSVQQLISAADARMYLCKRSKNTREKGGETV